MVDSEEWGRRAAEGGAWLLHLDTGLVDQAVRFYGAGEFVGEDGARVSAPVIGFGSGHTLVAREGSFLEMGVEDRRFFVQVHESLRAVLLRLVRDAAQGGVRADAGMPIIVGALKMQAMALEKMGREAAS